MIGLCKINITDKLSIGRLQYVQSVYTYKKMHELKERRLVENFWSKVEISKEENEGKHTKS